MIKLIASDVDGTLLPEGTADLNPELYDVILKLKEKGIVFAAASGRLGLDEADIISAIENGVNPKFVEVNKKVFEYAMKM